MPDGNFFGTTPSSGTLTTNHEKTMQTKNDTSKPETELKEETGEGCPEASCCASLALRLDRLKKIGKTEGKDAFESDLKVNDTRPFFCPGFPLILRKMKDAGYEMGDCEETVQAAFEFATAFRDEYSRLYFRHFAP
jgi:hypothetical protein